MEQNEPGGAKQVTRNLNYESVLFFGYVWYPKNRTDLKVIHEENDVIETQEELTNVKKKLKGGKHTCLIMRMEHPRAYEIR